jgi:hypothetical protein
MLAMKIYINMTEAAVEAARSQYRAWAPIIKYLDIEMTRIDYLPETYKTITQDM